MKNFLTDYLPNAVSLNEIVNRHTFPTTKKSKVTLKANRLISIEESYVIRSIQQPLINRYEPEADYLQSPGCFYTEIEFCTSNKANKANRCGQMMQIGQKTEL